MASTKSVRKLTESELSAKREKQINPKRHKWLNGIRRQIEDGTELGERLLKLARSLRKSESKELVKKKNLGTQKSCSFKRRISVSALERSMKTLSLVPKSSTTTVTEPGLDSGPVINIQSLPPKEVEGLGESKLLDLECLFRHADYYFRSTKSDSRSAGIVVIDERNKFQVSGSVAIRGDVKEESLMKMISKMNISNT